MQKPGNLRAEMPTVAGWIDDLRAAFGAETINAAIRAGSTGSPPSTPKKTAALWARNRRAWGHPCRDVDRPAGGHGANRRGKK